MSEERLLRSVQRLAAALGRQERQAAAVLGISVSQMRVLLRLEQAGRQGTGVSELADEEGLAVSTMTRNLALLERDGLVRRLPGGADRRTVCVVLTEAGGTLARELAASHAARFGRAFRAFHPSDRVERAVALDRVAAALERLEEPDPWSQPGGCVSGRAGRVKGG